MSEYIRRNWLVEHSAKGTPRFSRTHLFAEGRVTALCGRMLPRHQREAAIISGAGTPLCQHCAAALARES